MAKQYSDTSVFVQRKRLVQKILEENQESSSNKLMEHIPFTQWLWLA